MTTPNGTLITWGVVRRVLGSGEMTGTEIAGLLGAFPHTVGETLAEMYVGGVIESDWMPPNEVINAARTKWRLTAAERLAYALEHA